MFEEKDKNSILEDSLKELLEENGIEEEVEEEEEEEEQEDIEEEEEEEEESEVSEDEVAEEEDESEDSEEYLISEEEILPKRKPTPEEKQRYAFEKLRKEKNEKEAQLKELDEIAKRYGFASNEEMLGQLRKDSIAKEAKKQGIAPEILEKIQNQEKELKQIRQEREEETRRVKVNSFLNALETFSNEFKLNSTDKEQLLMKLDDDGYTLDTLLNIKNPKNLFKGYVEDKIAEKVKQNSIESEDKKKKLAEKKMKDTSTPTTVADLDAYLDKLVKESRGSKY